MKTETTKGGLVIPKQPKQKPILHMIEVYHLQDIRACIKAIENTEFANLVSIAYTMDGGGIFGSYVIIYRAVEPLSFETYC